MNNLKRLYRKLKENKWILWMLVAMVAINLQFGFDKKSEFYVIVNMGGMVIYMFCILMFMRGISMMQEGRMKDIERESVDFITACLGRGQGTIKYLVPYAIEGKLRRTYAKLFSRTYLRIYEASFWDEGISGMSAFKKINVSKKRLFEMKLRGMIETEDRSRAVQAMKELGVEWPLP
jgi:hypothetical protein